MTLLAALERVIAQREASLSEPVGSHAALEIFQTQAAHFIATHGPELLAAVKDAERYRWLKEGLRSDRSYRVYAQVHISTLNCVETQETIDDTIDKTKGAEVKNG